MASAKVDGLWAPHLMTFGPNLSLAREVLKHGDQQSRQAVLQFLEEVRTFWSIKPAEFEQWSADIVAGRMPDFNVYGPNLFY